MAKKGGNLVKLLAIGAAAAGTYYYLKKKNSDIPENMDDDDDDLDNFDANVEEPTEKRAYTSLNFGTVEQKVKDTAVKFADSAEKAYASVGEKLQGAAEKIEEFFDDRKVVDETEMPAEETAAEETETPEETEEKSYEIPIE